MYVLSLINNLGRTTIAIVSAMGAMFLFMLEGLRYIFTARIIPKVVKQVNVIGAQSFFLIALIGLFTGMVIGLQGYYSLRRVGTEGWLGSAVAISLVRELGPVLTAIMITGRAGSAMAAEIGVMRITDQIDALEVMDINPFYYLISPRFAASIIVFPMLTAIFDFVGIIGGYIAGVMLLGLNGIIYMEEAQKGVQWMDVAGGFYKAFAFALIVTAVCCYKGYYAHTRRDGVGPEAVSNATTSAVVLSSVLILAADYVITSVMM